MKLPCTPVSKSKLQVPVTFGTPEHVKSLIQEQSPEAFAPSRSSRFSSGYTERDPSPLPECGGSSSTGHKRSPIQAATAASACGSAAASVPPAKGQAGL